MLFLTGDGRPLLRLLGAGALVSVGLVAWCVMRPAHNTRSAPSASPCAGDFRWPDTAPTQRALRLKFVATETGAGLDSLRVRACAAADKCEAPLSETVTRGGGFASLTIDAALVPNGAGTSPGFNGYLMVEGEARRHPQKILRATPLQYQDCEVFRLSSEALTRALETALSAPVVETRAIVEAQVYDHTHHPASDVQLEVWNVSGPDYQLCKDCRFFSLGSDGRPNPAPTGGRSPDSAAWLVLTPRETLFVVRDAQSRRAVSALGPVVLSAESVLVVLTPASDAQLAALPATVQLAPRLQQP